jgi:predicted nuclease with RNAse H fold
VSATFGIDLASQPKRTAVAIIAWDEPRARLVELALHRDRRGDVFFDKYLVTTAVNLRRPEGCPEITKVAIDAPFGWPRDFITALNAYTDRLVPPVPMDCSRELLYRRTTDLLIAKSKEGRPLAVSVDKIGYCAIRTAVLLGEVTRLRGPEAAARDGSGLVCEVYPAVAARRWLTADAYRGPEQTELRAELFDRIVAATQMSDPHGLIEEARRSPHDDLLDALICALLARACELGQVDDIPAGYRDAALREGWIRLPSSSLEELLRPH